MRKLKQLENIDLKKTSLRDKNTKVMAATFITLTLILLVCAVEYIIPETVTVVYATVDSTVEETYQTRETKVEDVLKSAEISVDDHDNVSPSEDKEVEDGMTIKVEKTVEITAVIGGEEQKIWMVPGTVKDTLDYNNIEYDDDDEITPSLDTEMTESTKIVLNRVEYKTETKEETTEPETRIVLDSSVASGTVTTESGNSGDAIMEYLTKYVNGKEDSVAKSVKEWITEPNDNITRWGTSDTGQNTADGDSVSYSRTFTAETTAYYCGESAYGASGAACHYGTVAVDPSVIPLGTKLYIVGYGYAVATDTGSAVKGNVVDLYMHSMSECYSWGRRYVTAYVLN